MIPLELLGVLLGSWWLFKKVYAWRARTGIARGTAVSSSRATTRTVSAGTTSTEAEKTWLDRLASLKHKERVAIAVAAVALIVWRASGIPWEEISGTHSMLDVSGWAWTNWAAVFSLLGIGFFANWLISLVGSKEESAKKERKEIYTQVKTFLIGAMAVIFIGLPVTGTVVNFFNPDPSEVPATCPPMGYVDQTCVVTHVFSHPFGLLATVVIPQGAAPIPIMSTRGSGLAVAINGGGPNLWKLRATNQKSVEVTYRLPRPGQGI